MINQLFFRTTIVAVTSLAALASTHNAAAVALNPRGTGQVLLFPFYTVNGQNQTLISVTNTTERAKAVSVRFLEARNGRPVAKVNVYLAPFDTWTGAILDRPDDQPGARLIVRDRTCTVPDLANQPVYRDGLNFARSEYTGQNRDHPESLGAQLGVLERTEEGFIEVIEMGELQSGPGRLQLADEVMPNPGTGVPLDCGSVISAWIPPSEPQGKQIWAVAPSLNIDLPSGGLRGMAAIVNTLNGSMFTYTAEALTDFYSDTAAPGALHQIVMGRPTLADANNGGGQVRATVVDTKGKTITEVYPFPQVTADPVSLVLMQTRVFNDYNFDRNLGASSEWVLTFPTKHFYVNSATPLKPFTSRFSDDGRADEVLLVSHHDRSGRASNEPVFCIPSPSPCPGDNRLPNSANVLAINQATPSLSEIFGAAIDGVASRIQFDTTFPPVPLEKAGFLAIELDDPNTPGFLNFMTAPSGRNYFGLPVIGHAFAQYINRDVTPGVIANYAGETRHAGELVSSPPLP